ncbi:MAG: aminopeptidase P family protein [Pseudomonadales bacterium]|nr:aminopeptidase P family protein [Pseudomonadales bacterium]
MAKETDMNVCGLTGSEIDRIQLRLTLIRQEMEKHGLDAYVVPRADEYLGEYVPPQNERLAWLTGFSGSAGMAVVLKETAAIFVDGRYTIQVRQQVPDVAFEYQHLIENPPVKWLSETLAAGAKIGLDSRMHTLTWYQSAEKQLARKDMTLVSVEENPVDLHWQDRPEPEAALAMMLNESYTGESSESKRKRIGASIAETGADIALVSQLDSIAWLLNIRGKDVPRLPVLLGFATLDTEGNMALYTDPRKLPNDFSNHVGAGVDVFDDVQLTRDLENLGKENRHILADPTMANAWCQIQCRQAGATLIAGTDPVLLPKAQKNSVELSGIRNCHIRDGSAVSRYLAWIDREVAAGKNYNEAELSDQLESFRRELPDIHDLSFDTISAAGQNAALAHYNHLNGTPADLEMNNLYLVDSGGQYLDGTTDITRTIIIGEPSDEHKKMFTLVLKGHIALACAVFPEGTNGQQLDALARQFLWQHGKDYDHGTGHGVGAFLSVHEGPQRISKAGPSQALLPGMVISNEPGYYQEGGYGIRCENLIIVMQREDGMLCFETITFAPFDQRLIDESLLTPQELDWLNQYHSEVREKISPLLFGEDLSWLEASTNSIGS